MKVLEGRRLLGVVLGEPGEDSELQRPLAQNSRHKDLTVRVKMPNEPEAGGAPVLAGLGLLGLLSQLLQQASHLCCQWQGFALLCFAFIAFPSETHT